MKSLKRIINSDYLYSVIAKVFGVVLGFIYSILYSRYLGKELRGEASVIVNFSTLVSLVLCGGIYQAYPYFRKKNNMEQESLYMQYINNCLGLLLIYVFLCIFVVCFLPISLDRKVAFVLIPFLVGTRLLNYVVLIENPKIRNTASIYLYLIDIIVVLGLLIFTKANLFFMFCFLISKEVIYFIVAILNLKIPLSCIRPSVKNLWPYIKYGWIPMVSIILMEINYRVDILMLDKKVTDADIGVYSLGVQLAERLWLIPDALKDILLSKLTKGKGAEEVARITRISLASIMICIILAVVFGRFFIKIFFGEEYKDSYEIMIVILISVISMVFYKMVYSYNIANGHRVVNTVILGAAAISNVIINYLLIPIMGTMGAAIASLISYTVCGIIFLIYFVVNTHMPVHKMIFLEASDIKQLIRVIKIKKRGHENQDKV